MLLQLAQDLQELFPDRRSELPQNNRESYSSDGAKVEIFLNNCTKRFSYRVLFTNI